MQTRRHLLASGIAIVMLTACATPSPPTQHPPVVFMHGNGDSAALWQTTLWRFESNGWPRERLFALDQPYPLSRDDDAIAQPGDGLLQAVVSGLSHHSLALGLAYVLALGVLAVRHRVAALREESGPPLDRPRIIARSEPGIEAASGMPAAKSPATSSTSARSPCRGFASRRSTERRRAGGRSRAPASPARPR